MSAEVGGSNPELVAVRAAYSAPPFAAFAHPVVELPCGLPGCGLDGHGRPDLSTVSVGPLPVLVEHHIEIHGFLPGLVLAQVFQLIAPPSQMPQNPEPLWWAANLTHLLEHPCESPRLTRSP
jgi:hypothetical protein